MVQRKWRLYVLVLTFVMFVPGVLGVALGKTAPPHYEFDKEQEDVGLFSEFVWEYDDVYSFSFTPKTVLDKKYKWDVVVCSDLQGIEISYNQKKWYPIVFGPIPKRLIDQGWCQETNGNGVHIGNQLGRFDGTATYYVRIPHKNDAKFNVYAGSGTSIVVGSSSNGDDWGYSQRIWYDQNNDNWWVFYSDSAYDITSNYSSDNGTTWNPGSLIDAGTWTTGDFDVVRDYDGSTTYFHFVWAGGTTDSAFYKRCTAGATSISCGVDDWFLDSSTMGGSSLDDIFGPRIAIDENDCLLVTFGFEDNSRGLDEFNVGFTKEDAGTTCGDGDWDTNDHETGFPVWNVTTAWDTSEYRTSLFSWEDQDAQLVFNDGDTTTRVLYTLNFDGVTDSFGTLRTVDGDVETDTGMRGNGVRLNDSHYAVFDMDDSSEDLDRYLFVSRDSTLSTQVDTGINVHFSTGSEYGKAVGVLDTVNTQDELWVFGTNNFDNQDIYYATSDDFGATWDNNTLFVDDEDVGGGIMVALSAGFSNETCQIGLHFIGHTSDTVFVEMKTTGGDCSGGAPPADDCTYSSGNWVVDDGSICVITTDEDIGSNVYRAVNGGFRVTTGSLTGGGCFVNASNGVWFVANTSGGVFLS